MAPASEHRTWNREGEPHEVSLETEHAELRYEKPGNEIAETEHAELRNEEPRNEEVENQEPESPQSPHSSVPENPPPLENVLEVSTPTAPLHANVLDSSTSYVLLVRHNREKPPNRYSPNEEERKSKYPIANYVSTQGNSLSGCFPLEIGLLGNVTVYWDLAEKPGRTREG
ncbi:Retrovirus-related Pol polyprotein from transposon RE1 [Fagus crenata]